MEYVKKDDNILSLQFHECSLCGNRFPQEHSLNRHFIRNHNKREKQQECDLCEYSTTNPGNMAQHSLIHTEEKPYDCKDCREKFESAEELKGHMALHINIFEKEQVFSCKHCKQSFLKKGQLQAHSYIHRSRKLLSCDLCEYSSYKSYHLRRKQQKAH